MKIIRLILETINIEKQQYFYKNILGLPLIKENPNSFEVQIGSSVLQFVEGKEPTYYHFAINIPPNTIEQAREWLGKKVPLLRWESKEIVEFPNWNARGIYFYDADKNIVELIARQNLQLTTSASFSTKNFLHLSEIGVPTKNVNKITTDIQQKYGLNLYDGDLERFNAIGEETGLFIVINYKEKRWIPNMDQAIPSPFSISFYTRNNQEYSIKYENESFLTIQNRE